MEHVRNPETPGNDDDKYIARSNGGGRRLLRRTFIVALLLVSGGLLSSGAIELLFRYRESVEHIGMLQHEIARGAAYKIQAFVTNIEKTLANSTQTREFVTSGITNAYRFQLIKLLRVIPAITTVTAVDAEGTERLKVSRVQVILPKDLDIRISDPAFIQARQGASFFSPVYFVRHSEPYMNIAVPLKQFEGSVAGVLIAEVNLKYILDVVSQIKVGKTGYAYVVSREGDLIAHPDISLVLQKRSPRFLDQVRAAMTGISIPLGAQRNFAGQKVFPAYSSIDDLGWGVFVEQPVGEAYAPLYGSLLRTSILLLLGLCFAGLASLLISRRVVNPIRILRKGAARIGEGDLAHRIEIRTGDELESLADSFNHMAGELHKSYTSLEQKVEERTKELEFTVEKVINQQEQLEKQLNAARNIQTLFWPQLPSLEGGSHFWAVSIPALYVGGDLYDIIELPDRSFLVYVADVSDKGVPAALIMAALSTRLRIAAQSCRDISKLLQIVNASLYRLASDQGYFATLFIVRYWPRSGRLEYANAGHLLPFLFRKGVVTSLPGTQGMSLGVIVDSTFEKGEIELMSGDSLLIFSDGVLEAENIKRGFFGSDRIRECIEKTGKPPSGKKLIEALDVWRDDSPVNDDYTVLEIWRD